jgi:eukaryotic-like serine/threonine-protein kinase
VISDDDIDSMIRGVAAAPAREPQSSLVGEKIGSYHITRVLGHGGMGVVYVGEHPLIGKQVAVKVLHDDLARNPEVVARFFNEAKAVNEIHHENIVDILDFAQIKDASGRERVYVLMELLEGESLAQRLARGVPALDETVHIIDQVALALAASHKKGIVHRDLKPDNLFLTPRRDDHCFVKILDFGVAKLATRGGGSWKTRTGQIIGTPLYMSPEQCAGGEQVDARSDVYSLGVVMFELLTGRVPFVGQELAAILRGHLAEPPPRPSALVPGIERTVEDIVLRCLEKTPAARFPTMDALRVALAAVDRTHAHAAPTAVLAAPAPAPTPTVVQAAARTTLSSSSAEVSPAPAPRKRTLVFAGAVVVGAIALGVALLVAAPKPATPATAATAARATVRVTVDSFPQGASVRRAGVAAPLGTTPLHLALDRGAPPFEVMVALDGWKQATRVVPTDQDRALLVPLERVELPPASARPTAKAPAPPRPKKPRARKPPPKELGDELL